MSLAKRAVRIEESLTLAISAKAKKMKEDGIDVVSFGAGEPDFNTPQYIIDAAITALNKGMTKYTASRGTPGLRQQICKKFKADNGLDYNPNQIVVSSGAKQSLQNALLAIVDPEDEVILPSPYWLTYPELIKLCEGIPVYVETTPESKFKLTPTQLKKAITSKTKAIILNSPNNPTGSVYTKDELKALAEIIEKAGVYVISDEIYENLIYNGEKPFSIAACSPKLKEKTIVINGVSKTYAMTGWRIGYLAADEAIAQAIDNIQSHTTSNPNSIAQYATQIALTGGKEFLEEMNSVFDKRRKLMIELLSKTPHIQYVVPDGAFYVMVKISMLFNKTYKGEKIASAFDFAKTLLAEKAVAVIPAESFGAPEFIRLAYACSTDDIVKGIDRISGFIKELK